MVGFWDSVYLWIGLHSKICPCDLRILGVVVERCQPPLPPGRAGARAGIGMRGGACHILPGCSTGASGPKVSVTHSIFQIDIVSVYINQSTNLIMKGRLCGQKSCRQWTVWESRNILGKGHQGNFYEGVYIEINRFLIRWCSNPGLLQCML